MIEEEDIVLEEQEQQLSSRTLSFYGTHQRENKSKILYCDGSPYLFDLKIQDKNERIQAKYIFHLCFQLSSIIDYVSKNI